MTDNLAPDTHYIVQKRHPDFGWVNVSNCGFVTESQARERISHITPHIAVRIVKTTITREVVHEGTSTP